MSMDVNKLEEVLRATLTPNQREQAEQQLNEVSANQDRRNDHVHRFNVIKCRTIIDLIWLSDMDKICVA